MPQPPNDQQSLSRPNLIGLFFFFNDTATTEIYTLSLHDALPICDLAWRKYCSSPSEHSRRAPRAFRNRKSTRLNSSHANISYAVFCLKKSPVICSPNLRYCDCICDSSTATLRRC